MVTDAELVRPRREDRARLLQSDASSVVGRSTRRCAATSGSRPSSEIEVVRSGPHAGRLVDVFTLFHGSGANKRAEIAVLISDDKAPPGPNRSRSPKPCRATSATQTTVSRCAPATSSRTSPPDPTASSTSSGRRPRWRPPGRPSRSPSPSTADSPGPRSASTPSPTQAHPVDRGTARRHHRCAALRPAVQHTRPDTLPTDVWFLHSHDAGAAWTEPGHATSQLGHRMILSWGRTAGPSGLWPDEPARSGGAREEVRKSSKRFAPGSPFGGRRVVDGPCDPEAGGRGHNKHGTNRDLADRNHRARTSVL